MTAATVNTVRYGSVAAAIMSSICSGVKMGRRLASETLGRSEDSSSVVGLVPGQSSLRAANL